MFYRILKNILYYREKKRLPCFQRDSGKDEQKTSLRQQGFPPFGRKNYFYEQ